MINIRDMETKEDLERGITIYSVFVVKCRVAFDEYRECSLTDGNDSVSAISAYELWMALECRLTNIKSALLSLNKRLGGGPLGL